jgi:hypothetical protein
MSILSTQTGGVMYSSQQNHLNAFNLWKDALILHEINSGKSEKIR